MRYLRNYKLFETNKYIDEERNINYQHIFDYINDNFDYYEDLTIDYIINESGKFIQKIESLYNQNNTINVYRHMNVDESWVEELLDNKIDNLGYSWAYNKSKAHSWDSRFNKSTNVLLTSEVDVKYIDWYGTLELYFIFSGSESESELSLHKESKLDLKHLEIVNKEGRELIKKYDIDLPPFNLS